MRTKFTKKQKEDLETIEYFIPTDLRHILINDEDRRMFLENSERGLHKEKIKTIDIDDGFNALIWGKIWRGRHMEMYENGILDASMPYCVLLENTPKSVVDFMSKEIFKGIDGELIQSYAKNMCRNIIQQGI